MRIAHIAPAYPPYGGMGTAAKQMAGLARDLGHDVTLYTPRYLKNQENIGKDVFLKPPYSFGFASFLPQLTWKLRKFDLLHLHYPFYGSEIYTWLASVIWRKPLVLTYHMKTVGSGMKGDLFRLHRMSVEPFLFWRASRILVSSTDYAEAIGLPEDGVVDFPFWIDIESRKVEQSKIELRKKYQLQDKPTVIFVGGLDDAHYFKGVDVILMAMKNICASMDAQLVIVGEGNRRNEFAAQAKQLGIHASVHFMGRVSDEALKELYVAADVHTLPSIDGSEAFGLVTLEAMAAGIPSVVSDLPGVRSLVDNSVTGAIAAVNDPNDLAKKLKGYLIDLKKADEHGQAAQARAKRIYSPEKAAERLQAVYKAVKI